MNEKNDFALVRRPSSAVEKVAPRTKRILSGMIVDTLTLVKRARSLRIVLVDDEPQLLELYESLICKSCKDVTVLKFDDGNRAWQELLHKDPDLLITDINHLGLNGRDMFSLLAHKKVTFPIIVVSGNLNEKDIRQYASSELTISFLSKPFADEMFVKLLKVALKIPNDATRQDKIIPVKNRPPKIFVVNDESGPIESAKLILRKWFDKDAIVLTFEDSQEAWQELLRTNPDLLITDDIMPALGGMEIVRRLVERKAAYPVILTTSFERDELIMCVRECASQGLNIELLNVPYDIESFLKAVENSLKIPRQMQPIKTN